MSNRDTEHFGLVSSIEVLATSESGDRIAQKPGIEFRNGQAEGDCIQVYPRQRKQRILGIGSSFTESSAFVLAHLEVEQRVEVMQNIYSEQGANFSLARTPIGSCDFCVEGNYSYADRAGDMSLSHFSVAVDHNGFSARDYPGIRDERFDLLPMIQEALRIKSRQQAGQLRIIASAWTAPYWMKDIGEWYQAPGPENNFNGHGGMLKQGYECLYADYLLKYLQAYRHQGVEIWGVTPVNEPLGNSGQWESMHFSPHSQKNFIRDHLGPRLQQWQEADVSLLMYDHARDQLASWADVIYSDPACARYVDGAAIHWYESSYKVYEDELDKVHGKYPDFSIVHTEGCIDDLGNDAPEGIGDPVRFKESNWFDNDDFWWNDNATDWGYTATWPGVDASDHPIYTPVHRYARNIIVSLNHWVSGWIDWNIVLDQRGGPNHVGNHCGAPIMVDVESGYVYYTPIYFILAQFSRTIRPGDVAVHTDTQPAASGQWGVYACSSINADGLVSVQVLNTEKRDIDCSLQVGAQHAMLALEANSLQTIKLPVSAVAAR